MLHLALDPASEVPLYRQLFEQLRQGIEAGQPGPGERLPATRELAGLLGVNRATITAAYELLEAEGLIAGHVGRGSFVAERPRGQGVTWDALLSPAPPPLPLIGEGGISFSTSRPPENLFPLDEFRAACEETMARADFAQILQLGSPAGYEPLRHHLLEDARRRGIARAGDDLLITNGCQQALDLVCRVLIRRGDTVAVEDPIYPGLKNLFTSAGARLAAMPVGGGGIDPEDLTAGARLTVVTPNYQNPTGATMPLAARTALAARALSLGVVLVENDIYGDLRYAGEELPSLKALDDSGNVIVIGSFSKIAFPGLRVGWAIGPKALIARMVHAKHLSDLHTDQLSQAVLLRFAESGRLDRHRKRMLEAGAERLHTVLDACARHLPAGTRFTKPSGGMNLWVTLPEPLDSYDLLGRAQRENVSYLPGRYFTVARPEPGGLRLSFASLAPEKIRQGLAILGNVFAAELARDMRPAMAMV
jgi:2-aminoadipate transaminase